mgnify:FL=1
MKAKKLLSILLAASLTLSMLAACSGNPSSESSNPGNSSAAETDNNGGTETKYVDELNVGTYNSNLFTACFDPTSVYAGSVMGNGALYMVYDVLFYLDPTTKTGNSRILESWDWDDTYTQLSIKLRDNIFFSNGTQLKCSDILYSIDQMTGQIARAATFKNYDLDASRATISDDGLSMTLMLHSTAANFYDNATFAILCEDYIENEMGGGENIDWFDPDQVVGSGSYKPTDFVPGSSITLEKREDYWGLAYGYDDPYLVVNATNYTDQSTMAIELETGTLDVAIDLAINDFDRLDAITDDNITTVAANGNSNWNLTLATNANEALKDPLVRQAICEAIDTKALTDAVAGSYGTVADSILASGEIGYVGGHAYEYNPDHARELLAQAGYSDGDIKLHMLIMNSEPCPSICVVLQQYLKEIGIELTYESMDMATYNSAVGTEGATDMMLAAMAGMNASGDPAIEMNWFLSTSNYAGMRKSYDDLIQAGLSTMDMTARADAYGQIQDLFYENYEAVPLYTLYKGYAYNNEIFSRLTIASTLITWLFDCELA